MSQTKHNCGWCVTHTLHDAYSFIKSLQHRGREATGIAAIANGRIDVIKWRGPVSKFDVSNIHKAFPDIHYHTFMSHVRYATTGRDDKILEDAHPHVIGGINYTRGNNHIFIKDCDAAIVHNGQINSDLIPISNHAVVKTECDSEILLNYLIERNEFELISNVPGSYTLAFAEKNRGEVVVMRDPLGMHPGVLGEKDRRFGAASEDIAFKENGGKVIENLAPGCVYYLTPEATYRKKKIIDSKRLAHCMFEYNYILNESTTADSISVDLHRRNLGEQLANEFNPKDADFVTYAPSCPEKAARRYSEVTGIQFIDAFYKCDKSRSFQGTTKNEREKSIDENLFLRPGMEEYLKGSTLIIVEDSLVRGNVIRRLRNLIYDEANVKKAYLASFTPPLCIKGEDGIDRGCMFGVDMPPTPAKGEEYIARGRTPEQIREITGMQVYYLSIDGMFKAFRKSGISQENLCSYCLGGEHPFIRIMLNGKPYSTYSRVESSSLKTSSDV